VKLLLTGSSGWLGRFLAPRAIEAGHEVVGLDVAPGEYTRVRGSVADRALLDRVFRDERPDAVIHCGALHKPDIARFDEDDFWAVNAHGTRHLLDLAADAGHDRFVHTSTTSLMISKAVRAEEGEHAVWMDETFAPLKPRNIYGITKLAAEQACREVHDASGMAVVVLRTSRFFPEDDDTHAVPAGDNLKANELLYRRLTVEDAARAHLAALDAAPRIGFGTYIVSAPTPFQRDEVEELKRDARAVILGHFPEAEALYARAGWVLPDSIGRVYDSSAITRDLGFAFETDFAAVLAALRNGDALPFVHDPDYVSPVTLQDLEPC
jgi:nucleoside-diphosphate-sugar epimerase